ncbi:major facilitator superfamily domain-containing protein [Phyllosticta citrichinensis]|uniref:Major facilitator superfamily domain-containing protein n=1 Tax=Phyllosticta citrichinensis TaxID=1130410 RepID=A0ABR1XLL6_9PEZI
MSKLEDAKHGHVEHREVVDQLGTLQEPVSGITGTVKLAEESDLFLIPAPSADPRDPLNMSKWRKMMFVALVSIFSSLGLSLVSGLGGLLSFYIPAYTAEGATYADITALMTYPSMFMGIGNIISMPLALAVGRRPVFLASTLLLFVSAILCGYANTYKYHYAARLVLGLAAGQSEALVPLMVEEIHFLHERSHMLMIQSASQTILSAVLILCASPIAGAITPRYWYVLGGGIAAAQGILSIFFVPESRYSRPLSAYQGESSGVQYGSGTTDATGKAVWTPVTKSNRPELDFVNFEPRTVLSDMRLFVGKADWMEAWYTLKSMVQVLFFPNVFWAFCLNGLTIGVNVAIGTTYGAVIEAPPYNWSASSASYVNAGQIVTALVALPLLGTGSDKIIKWRAKKNGGIHEPENRLLPLIVPIMVGIIAAVLHGEACQHPGDYHWFALVFANAGYYFCFVGANIAAITYLLDSYPARGGPMLVVICALRGFVSFGVSFGVADFIERSGYDGSFGTYAGLTGLFGLLGIAVFFTGKRIRAFTGRWTRSHDPTKPTMTH